MENRLRGEREADMAWQGTVVWQHVRLVRDNTWRIFIWPPSLVDGPQANSSTISAFKACIQSS